MAGFSPQLLYQKNGKNQSSKCKNMAIPETLTELFCRRVRELGQEAGLTEAEIERIIAVYKLARANTYMDERRIWPKLTEEEPL
jgi:hypothetical protein